MAGNTKCYRVTVKDDGTLHGEVTEFSPRFADSVDMALTRLQRRGYMQPPIVKFSNWEELQRRWAEQGEVQP